MQVTTQAQLREFAEKQVELQQTQAETQEHLHTLAADQELLQRTIPDLLQVNAEHGARTNSLLQSLLEAQALPREAGADGGAP